MRFIKSRKPRGRKLNGERSMDLCPCCYSFRCDPMGMSIKFQSKIHNRIKNGQCPACGRPTNYCSCKSSLKLRSGETRIVTHNNRKRR